MTSRPSNFPARDPVQGSMLVRHQFEVNRKAFWQGSGGEARRKMTHAIDASLLLTSRVGRSPCPFPLLFYCLLDAGTLCCGSIGGRLPPCLKATDWIVNRLLKVGRRVPCSCDGFAPEICMPRMLQCRLAKPQSTVPGSHTAREDA